MDKVKAVFRFWKTEKGAGILFVVLAVIINAILLGSELTLPTLSLNDEVLHLTATQDAVAAIRSGQDPTDFWLPEFGMGYPLFHHYQHLPQLCLAAVNLLTASFLPLAGLFNLSRYLLLVLFPLSMFWSMRRFGFGWLAAGISALFASLLSTNGLYGFDYNSYVWQGYGLYTQLWAMFFLPLALAEIYRTMKRESSFFWPVFLSAVVLLSNLLYGYILFVSAGFMVFLKFDRAEFFARVKRLAIIAALTLLVNLYFILPSLLDRNYFNATVWFESYRYDSYGHLWVLENLFNGRLFDYGRYGSCTLLFFLGIFGLAVSKPLREEKNLFLLVLTVVWLLLYFGRPTWGSLYNLLPLSADLQANRFLGGFHLAGIMVVGAGLDAVWRAMRQKAAVPGLLAALIFLASLSPVLVERVQYYRQDTAARLMTAVALTLEEPELAAIYDTLKTLPPGKIYAGLPSNFGNTANYKIGSLPLYAIFPQIGIDSFGYAYHAFALSDDVRLNFDAAQPAQYNLFNIRYVLLHKSWTAASFYTPVKIFENYVLYQTPGSGYFDFTDANAVFYGPRSDFYQANARWLESALPGLKQSPILVMGDKPPDAAGLPVYPFNQVDDKLLVSLAPVQAPAEAGQIFNQTAELNKYAVRFETVRETYLMLKANYHPGWHAYLDGEEVTPVMLAPGFTGIKVQPGRHEATFVYQPPAWRFPLLLMGCLVLAALAVIAVKPGIIKLPRKANK